MYYNKADYKIFNEKSAAVYFQVVFKLDSYFVFISLTHFASNSLSNLFQLKMFTKFTEEKNFLHEFVNSNISKRALFKFFINTKLFGKESHTFNIIFSRLIFSALFSNNFLSTTGIKSSNYVCFQIKLISFLNYGFLFYKQKLINSI